MSKDGEPITSGSRSLSGEGNNRERIIIIGEKGAVWIFQGLGIEVIFVQSVDEAKGSLEKAVAEKYQFICLTETYAEELIPLINELTADTDICVTVIPGISVPQTVKGKKDSGFERLRKFSERGIGVDLVSSKLAQ